MLRWMYYSKPARWYQAEKGEGTGWSARAERGTDVLAARRAPLTTHALSITYSQSHLIAGYGASTASLCLDW